MAGCPFGPSFPGWRILVEAFYTPNPGRTYGQGTYGSDVYGDLTNTAATWVDITTPAFALTVRAGSTDAAPVVPVSEFTLELHDDTGAWWDYAAPYRYNLPAVGTKISFGLIDPGGAFHPLGFGHVEAITDEHDRKPRFVTITAYGNLSWLVTSAAGWARPAEAASTRVAALIAAAGTGLEHSTPGDQIPMLADTAARTITVRDELDRTAVSAGWYLVEDRTGVLRFRRWPHEWMPAASYLTVADCVEEAGELLAHVINYVADTAAVLNTAIVTNAAPTPVNVESVNQVSVAKYGRRSDALGFPHTGLAFVDAAAGGRLADTARARYQDIVNRVESFEADSRADARWLAALAALEVGRPVLVRRHGFNPFSLDTICTGYELRLEADRIAATVYVTTITPTL